MWLYLLEDLFFFATIGTFKLLLDKARSKRVTTEFHNAIENVLELGSSVSETVLKIIRGVSKSAEASREAI